jgi:hypothetical protein
VAWVATCPPAANVQGTNELFRIDFPAARLALIADRSACSRGQVPDLGIFGGLIHRDIFHLGWGPAIQAVTAILEAAPIEDTHTIADGMHAFTTVRVTCISSHS